MKFKRSSAEIITIPITHDCSIHPKLNYYGTNVRVKFTESCLKQSILSYAHSNIVNIYIVYELGTSSSHNSDPSLKHCLFSFNSYFN